MSTIEKGERFRNSSWWLFYFLHRFDESIGKCIFRRLCVNGFESCRDWKGLVDFITAYRYKTEDQTNHKWDDLNYYAISNSSWKFLSKSPCLPIRERFERSIVNVRKKLFLSSIFPSNSFGEISIVKISKRRLDKRNTSKSTIEFPCLDIRHSEWPGLLWNFQCNFYRFIDVSTRSVNLITLSVFFNFSIFFSSNVWSLRKYVGR